MRQLIEDLASRLPIVKRPIGHVHFRAKLFWTLGVLLLYFVLINIPMFGLSPESVDIFAGYRMIMAGESGSILHLGIGPIVTASIILQLMVGARIIKLDLTQPEDQLFYQSLQRIFVYLVIVLNAFPQVLGGFLLPDEALSAKLGTVTVQALLFLQLCLGGVLIMLLDELVSKWGIGSGIGLFIAAGVSQGIVHGLFSWELAGAAIPLPVGFFPKIVHVATNSSLAPEMLGNPWNLMFIVELLPFMITIALFLLVIYLESCRVEIPLAHSRVRGAYARFPIKLLYASVLPVIFVSMIFANIQMIGQLFHSRGITFLGEYADGIPVSGIWFLLSEINGPWDWIPELMAAEPRYARIQPWEIWAHLAIYIGLMVSLCIAFALFWVEISGMDPKSVAEQMSRSGLQIPGFRSDPIITQRMMARYIPRVTVLSGILIALIAILGNLGGTVGRTSGTSILLAVGIIYRMYEDLSRERMMELHPLLRKFIGEEI